MDLKEIELKRDIVFEKAILPKLESKCKEFGVIMTSTYIEFLKTLFDMGFVLGLEEYNNTLKKYSKLVKTHAMGKYDIN